MIDISDSFPAQDECLDNLVQLYAFNRLNWLDEPTHLDTDDYVYSPTYGISGALLYNWEESDSSLRKRIKEKYYD